MIGVGIKNRKDISQLSAEFLDCPNLEGILKKKNSHGQWKDRYCLFKKNLFITYRPKGNKPTNEIKESVDLKDVDKVVLKDDNLNIETCTGEVLLFRGNNIQEWAESLRIRSCKARQIYQKSLAENYSNGVHLAGWLLKKSHNKYQGFQERFVKIDGHFLRYYRREGEINELGSANLVTADFIRPYDDTPDCKIFELQDEDRVFAFQANSNKEMLYWINILEQVKLAAQTRLQEELQKKLVEETPTKIRWFDENGESFFREKVLKELSDIYPDPTNEEQEAFSIKDHLDCANGIVEYLQSFVPAVQKTPHRPARYDILALMMTAVNTFLYDRMSSFLVSTANAQRITMKSNCFHSQESMVNASAYDELNEDESLQHRSELIENASLGDLHAIIDWISKYQITIKKVRCPVAVVGKDAINNPVSSSQAVLSSNYLSPKQSRLFELLPDICKLYVYGGSKGSKGGAASHLYDHCIKVWESVVNNPEEMLQKNNDGSFYTHAPVDMWEAINQHISLATSTNSPILHVMIADKVVASLLGVFEIIINYVTTLDTSTKPELREIELEYISALANDTALHIEEVIELIDNFTIAEIRERIDEIFDPLTTILVKCGETCLKRLASLVMSDVQGLLEQVFMPEWMEGNQMHIATATISDYMNDFEEYLVTFWADKFVYIILEEVIISYIRSLLFKKTRTTKTVTTTVVSQDNSKSGFFSSIFLKTKESIVQTVTVAVPAHVPVDEDSLGRLAQDVNILNAFFSQKASQDTATEFLSLMNEISLMLFLDMAGLLQHFTLRVTEYPSAAQAIYEITIAIMKLRFNDFTKSDFEFFSGTTESLLTSAVQDAREREAKEELEGRLGLLFIEVTRNDSLKGPQKLSLAQRVKMMSNIPIFGHSTIKKHDSEDFNENDGEDGAAETSQRDSAENRRGFSDERIGLQKSTQLLDDVMEVLQQQDLAEENEIQEQERIRQQEELIRKKVGVLSYDGYLEKKSPAHNLWQKRYFKLVTRETQSLDKPYLYSLMWYKKEGGSVIKALEIDKIQSLAVLCSNRALSYALPPRGTSLSLQSESGSSREAITVLPLEHEDNASGKQGSVDYYIFRVLQSDNKEHVLRSAKIDRVMRWINSIAFAGSLAYDPKLRQWTRAAFAFYEEQAKEKAETLSFQTVLATPLPPLTPSTTNRDVSGEAPRPTEIDLKGAAELISSLKEVNKEVSELDDQIIKDQHKEEQTAEMVNPIHQTQLTDRESNVFVSAGSRRANRSNRHHKPPPPASDEREESESSQRQQQQQRRSISLKRVVGNRARLSRLSLTEASPSPSIAETETVQIQTEPENEEEKEEGEERKSLSPKSSLKKTSQERSLSRSSLRVSFAEHLSNSDEGRTIHSFEVEEGQDPLLQKKKSCRDSCLLL